MKRFLRQQVLTSGHPKRLMFKQNILIKFIAILIIFLATLVSGCGLINPKSKQKVATLLDTSDATQTELMNQVNYFAKVNSMRADVDLKFEDNSYAELGIAEKYTTADGLVVVQRPAKIFLKVKAPFIKTEIVQMTSDGEKFRLAILQDGAKGKYKKFILGTNNADYSVLQKKVTSEQNGESKDVKKNVNAFANLRPQHFTDAMLVRPIDTEKYSYTFSTIVQEEKDIKKIKKKSPIGWVLRGFYLLDEFRSNDDGTMTISRRFWFDRVGGINLARQQLFDAKGEIESDIVYGKKGRLTKQDGYNLPLLIEITRPKEKYKMRLTYQSPKKVKIGKVYQDKAFVLKNSWELEEVNLDSELKEVTNQSKKQNQFETQKTN